MKIKLLLSGLGGSLFPYLHDQLKAQYELFYVDADEELRNMYGSYNFFAAPWISDAAYWPFIKNIILTNNIDYYVPLIDEEIVEAKKNIEGYNGVKVMSPLHEFAALSMNKFQLMQQLEEQNISFVPSFSGDNFNWQIEPPVFVKPISGRGSRGIRKITSQKQLQAYYELEKYKPAEIIVQENLIGIEYTVGVLVNNMNDVIGISSKRVIRKKGITQIAVTENNPIIDEVTQKVVFKLKPCGPINIQLIMTPKNEVKIFEINPRFSTTSIMEYAGGVDLMSLYINWYNKKYTGPIIRPKEHLLLYRRWENVFYALG